MKRMSDKKIQEFKDKIDNATHRELAILYRFAPVGHPVFSGAHQDLALHFQERFDRLGGMTPKLSKDIGWR